MLKVLLMQNSTENAYLKRKKDILLKYSTLQKVFVKKQNLFFIFY